MKIYLAASWLRRLAMRKYARELENMGIIVTSRWLYEHKGMVPDKAAQQDLEDINHADAIVLFTNNPEDGYLTGGKFVEMGYALAMDKQVVLIGGSENIFCMLPEVEIFENWRAFKKHWLVGVLANEMRKVR